RLGMRGERPGERGKTKSGGPGDRRKREPLKRVEQLQGTECVEPCREVTGEGRARFGLATRGFDGFRRVERIESGDERTGIEVAAGGGDSSRKGSGLGDVVEDRQPRAEVAKE